MKRLPVKLFFSSGNIKSFKTIVVMQNAKLKDARLIGNVRNAKTSLNSQWFAGSANFYRTLSENLLPGCDFCFV